jgi:hypothetical protein
MIRNGRRAGAREPRNRFCRAAGKLEPFRAGAPASQTACREAKRFPSSLLAGKVRREAGEEPNPALQALYEYALKT